MPCHHVVRHFSSWVFSDCQMKRAMQSLIENPLAETILAGNFPVGSAIKGSLVNGRPQFVTS